MDQTGVYALKDALTGLISAGVRVFVVAHRDLLEKLQVIPVVVPESDVFNDFEELKKAFARSIGQM